MSIVSGSLMTWADFSTTCLSAIKNVCCNIDAYKSDVPARLKAGSGQVTVKSIQTGISGSTSKQTFYWYATPGNLINLVSTANVESEWNTFITAAGGDSRSNKILQEKEILLLVGLYMQFMSYHVKPICSRRQAYNTVEAQTLYKGNRYITGSLTPKYILTEVEPSKITEINDEDITKIVNQNFQGNQLLSSYENPIIPTVVLT